MSVHDRVIEFRAQLVAVIDAAENKRAACAQAGVHRSTFYRWRNQPMPQRPARSLQQRYVEDRVVAAALASPQLGPVPLRDVLARDGVTVSASTVWRILVRRRPSPRVGLREWGDGAGTPGGVRLRSNTCSLLMSLRPPGSTT